MSWHWLFLAEKEMRKRFSPKVPVSSNALDIFNTAESLRLEILSWEPMAQVNCTKLTCRAYNGTNTPESVRQDLRGLLPSLCYPVNSSKNRDCTLPSQSEFLKVGCGF